MLRLDSIVWKIQIFIGLGTLFVFVAEIKEILAGICDFTDSSYKLISYMPHCSWLLLKIACTSASSAGTWVTYA